MANNNQENQKSTTDISASGKNTAVNDQTFVSNDLNNQNTVENTSKPTEGEQDINNLDIESKVTNQSTDQPKSKSKLIAVIVALLIILIGVTSTLYYLFVMIPNLPSNRFKKSLATTFDTSKTHTFSYQGSLKMASSSEGLDIGSLNFDGNYDIKSELNSTEVSFAISAIEPKIKFQNDSSGNMYLKISNIENLSDFAPLLGFEQQTEGAKETEFQKMISSVNNQWMKFTSDEVDQLLNQSTTQSPTESSNFIEDLFAKMQDLENSTIENNYPDEKIGDEVTRHYQIKLDVDAVNKIKDYLLKSNLYSTLNTQLDLAQSDWSKPLTAESIDKYKVDVWVNKSDNRLAKILVTSDNSELIDRLEIKMNKYNQEFAPENTDSAVPYRQVWDPVFEFFEKSSININNLL